jgi:hypothetical protein
MNKTCLTCKREMPIDDFGKNKATDDGLNYICLSCDRKRHRASKLENLEREVRVLFNGRCALCDTVENLEVIPMLEMARKTARGYVLICSHCKANGIPTVGSYRRDCARCGYTWIARNKITLTCPGCGSARWHLPKVKK